MQRQAITFLTGKSIQRNAILNQLDLQRRDLGLQPAPLQVRDPTDDDPVPLGRQGLYEYATLRRIPAEVLDDTPGIWLTLSYRVGAALARYWLRMVERPEMRRQMHACDLLEDHLVGMAKRHQIPTSEYKKLLQMIALKLRRYLQNMWSDGKWKPRFTLTLTLEGHMGRRRKSVDSRIKRDRTSLQRI